MFGRILSRAVALSFFVLLSVLFIAAQDLDDVTISGRVTDSNGLAVVGASVTVTSVETGESRTLVTNDDGQYRFLKLKPGTYRVKAAATGFGILETPDIPTISAQNLQKDFKLSPADVSAEQTVIVTEDDGPPVDTTRTIVGGTVTEREIEEIPNNTRNALDLVLTLGGTSEEQLSTNDLAEDRGFNPRNAPLEQGNFSISGGTAYSNNLTIDGFDNNDDRSSRDRFQPSLEGISEVQVIANQFSAEYGRASGGRINIRTRAGGKRFRGRAFMFFRDESMNANSWYNNSRGIARPALQELNPGFTLSGPVFLPGFGDGADYPYFNGRKQKTFFAIAYEYNKQADTTLIDAYLPLTANPSYPLPDPTGTTQYCDAAGSPAPPCAPGVAAIAAYNKLYDTPNKGNVLTARVDTELFTNNTFTFGFQFGRKNNKRTSGNSVQRLENAFQAKNINTDAYNFTDNHVFGARAVNQVRLQWSRFQPSFEAPNPFDPVVIVGYRDPIANAVRSLVMGNSTVSVGSNFSDTRNETRWQFQESLTYLMGRHTFKMGFDIQNVNSEVIGLGDATGTFNFGSSFDFTENRINRYRQNFGTGQTVKNRYYGIFFNDEYKPWSNVTVSAGLRYERETAVTDTNNFGPRIGVAWDPFKKGTGVIRFGAGIFYNRVLLRTVGDSIQNSGGTLVNFDTSTIGTSAADPRRSGNANSPGILATIGANFPNSYPTTAELRALVQGACNLYLAGGGTLPCNSNTGFSVGNVSSAGNPLRSVEPDLRIPESYQFNVGFEREIFKSWVVEANYTWNKTSHLWRDSNANAPVLPDGYADWTEWLIDNPFVLSPTRTYTFFLGPTNDTSGLHVGSETGVTPCTTTTTNCYVNLNTTNSSSTAPLIAVTGQNNNATGAPIGIATAAIAPFRRDQTVTETSLIGSRGNAFYQGLILELRSRYRKLGYGLGASFRMAYTLSKTMDDGLNNTANAEVNGDFSREWARSLQDRRHRFALTGTFDTPWWFAKLRFSPRFRYGTSAPFNLGAGGSDRNLDDLGTDRVNFSGNIKDIISREPGSPIPTALLAQFSLQPIGAKSGNLPRNAGTGPSFYTFDLSVTREIRVGERLRFRPVVQFDNILNAAVFNYGSAFIDLAITPAAQTNFLVPTRTYRQRQIRAGIRIDF